MTTMIGYLRVSTGEQADSGLGLEAQRSAILDYANRMGWDIVWYEDAGYSGKDQNRPALQEALARLHPKKRDVDGIVVAKLDRLSRSVHDFSGLLELAISRGWALAALDLEVDTSTPMGEFFANVMAAMARWERRTIGARTSAALQTLKQQGVKLGRPVSLPADTAAKVQALRAEGLSFRAIATRLNDEGVPTAHGKQWVPSTVSRLLNRLTKEAAAPAA